MQSSFVLLLLWLPISISKPGDFRRHELPEHRLRHGGRGHHLPDLSVLLEDRTFQDGPGAPATLDSDEEGVPGDSDIAEHLKNNCSTCLQRDEAKLARKAQIEKNILERLGFGSSPPNVSVTRDMPSFGRAPLNSILQRYGFQSDSPVPYQEEMEEENTYAKTENVYSFSRSPNEQFGWDEQLQTAYFDFAHDTQRMTVRQAQLHIYLQPPQAAPARTEELKIEVFHRLKKGKLSERPVYTKKIKHFLGSGSWVEAPFQAEVVRWFRKPEHNNGIYVRCEYEGQNLAVHPQDNDEAHNMYLEIATQDSVKSGRQRRDVDIDCQEDREEKRCCRYPLTINFEEFGWDWVIAPKYYRAYYCNGQCPFKHLQRYVHTHVLQQAKEQGMLPDGTAGPCCYPTQMAPLMMVYMNENKEVLVSRIPGMVATRCGCA